MATITWLHLSDLHFQTGDAHNRKIVLDALWQDIKTLIDGGTVLPPDFIAFTGDVAWQGRPEEYELAEEHFFRPLLKVTGRSPAELFVVPGNHDVDWDIVGMLSADMVAGLNNRDAVNNFLASDKKRQTFLRSLEGYADLVRRVFVDHWEPQDPAYYYVRTIEVGDKQVAVLGLNSAWLSGFAKEGDEVSDYGHLLVGEKQISEAVEKIGKADIRIALMHHPFEWLQEFDRDDAESWLRRECHFILRGHRHRTGFIQEATLDGKSVIIPAGAIYDRRTYPNGYSFVQLDLGTGRGTMYLRRYIDRKRRWGKDTDATGDERDGCLEFPLPQGLGLAVVLGAEVPSAETPPATAPTGKASSAAIPSHSLGHLRELEQRLEQLNQVYSISEQYAQRARYDGRRLNLKEFEAISQTWGLLLNPYTRVLTLASRISSSDRYTELVEDLQEAYQALGQAVADAALNAIPDKTYRFSTVLTRLRVQVSGDIDRFIG